MNSVSGNTNRARKGPILFTLIPTGHSTP